MSALPTALDYAARGFMVFPCLERRKEPACGRGFHDATTNPATIRRWFSGPHSYNIAIATGPMSGVWVFDVDGSIGALVLAELEAKHGMLPDTLISITAAGCHFWFRYLDGPIPSSTSRIGPGLDVRADAAYVVAPPSVHPDGPIYRWSNDRPPAPAPEWLVKLARHKPGAPKLHIVPRPIDPRANGGKFDAYGQAALDDECDLLAKTPPGARNHQLNYASFRLHQLVAGGELDAAEVRERLIAAAIANGLMDDPHDGPRRVMATIASGARAGLQYPRSREERRT